MKKIILLFFAFHFVVLSCNILSKHLKFEILNSLTSIYTFPFFNKNGKCLLRLPHKIQDYTLDI